MTTETDRQSDGAPLDPIADRIEANERGAILATARALASMLEKLGAVNLDRRETGRGIMRLASMLYTYGQTLAEEPAEA